MKVKFLDLTTETKSIKKDYLREVGNLLDRGNFILTEEVGNFERSFSRTLKMKHCVGVSSGADALYLSLTALGVGAGDEVITQGNAYNASVTAILRTGATPRFADIKLDTLTMNVRLIEALINRNTKAILPVHLFGQPNNMTEIMRIAKKHKLFVVEDCAQAHLATWQGRFAGSFGDIGAFSFYPTKNLGAFGDAGAIVTNNVKLAEKIKVLRNLGQAAKNKHIYLGYNHRLDPVQAIALNLKLSKIEKINKKRRAVGAYYDKILSPMRDFVRPVSVEKGADHVYHLYVIRALKMSRDSLRKKLEKLGVQTAVHYPVPVYRQPFFGKSTDHCPITDLALNQILSLPMYPEIKREEQEYVVNCIKKITKYE